MGANDPRAEDERSVGGPPPARHTTPGATDAFRMAALVEFSEDPIIGLTLDGHITDWNPAAERLYGYSRDEMRGASIAMLVPPELRGRTGNLLGKVQAGEVVRQLDTQRMAKDGRRIDVSISMAPIRDDAGTIVGAAAFTRDISVRIAADERLRRSEAQLAEAQRLAAVGSWEWDVVSGQHTWSSELFRILGRDPDESAATYEAYFGAIHPDSAPRPRRPSGRRSRAASRSTTSAARCGLTGSSGSSTPAAARSGTIPGRSSGSSEPCRT